MSEAARVRVRTAVLVLAALLALLLCIPRQQTPETIVMHRTAATTAPLAMPNGLIDPNTADRDELMQLSGVGETLADAIITERETNGIFYYPEDLLNVKGIGPAKLQGFWDELDFSESTTE